MWYPAATHTRCGGIPWGELKYTKLHSILLLQILAGPPQPLHAKGHLLLSFVLIDQTQKYSHGLQMHATHVLRRHSHWLYTRWEVPSAGRLVRSCQQSKWDTSALYTQPDTIHVYGAPYPRCCPQGPHRLYTRWGTPATSSDPGTHQSDAGLSAAVAAVWRQPLPLRLFAQDTCGARRAAQAQQNQQTLCENRENLAREFMTILVSSDLLLVPT